MDDWSLKGRHFDIEQDHRECYGTEECCYPSLEREYSDDGEFFSVYDIEVLRQKLIEDIEEMGKEVNLEEYQRYFTLAEIRKIINKRFGVDVDE